MPRGYLDPGARRENIIILGICQWKSGCGCLTRPPFFAKLRSFGTLADSEGEALNPPTRATFRSLGATWQGNLWTSVLHIERQGREPKPFFPTDTHP